MNVIANILLSPIKLIKNAINIRIVDKNIRATSINKIDAIDGYEFEVFIENLLKTIGYKSITTKKSRDYGADIVAKNRKETIVIQTKLYYNHNVGLGSVQEAKSALNYYMADKAMVITNSHFTKSTKTLAKSTNVALIDREQLIALMQANRKERKALFFNYVNTI